jgi:hypothetical protein
MDDNLEPLTTGLPEIDYIKDLLNDILYEYDNKWDLCSIVLLLVELLERKLLAFEKKYNFKIPGDEITFPHKSIRYLREKEAAP